MLSAAAGEALRNVTAHDGSVPRYPTCTLFFDSPDLGFLYATEDP